MSITDELRKAINQLRVECEEKEGCGVLWYPEPTRDRFSAVADRIDERWEREEADFDLMCNKIAAQATCLVEVGEALGVSADQPDSEFFWELTEAARGCIQLPKDADGEPWRVGDMTDHGRVIALHLVHGYWFVEWESEQWELADSISHAQPDSWERIIADAAATRGDFDELVARCKRLAGEDA